MAAVSALYSINKNGDMLIPSCVERIPDKTAATRSYERTEDIENHQQLRSTCDDDVTTSDIRSLRYCHHSLQLVTKRAPDQTT